MTDSASSESRGEVEFEKYQPRKNASHCGDGECGSTDVMTENWLD